MKKLAISLIALIFLVGCASTPQVNFWQHYENCAATRDDIREIAACGKETRLNYLRTYGGEASSDGNRYDQYMSVLAEQVNEKKLSNSQAKMQWIQLTDNMIQNLRNQAMMGAAVGAMQRQEAQGMIQRGQDMMSGACTLGVNC